MTEPDPTWSAARSPLLLLGVAALALGAAVFLVLSGGREPGSRSVDGEPLVESTPVAGVEQAPERPVLEHLGAIDGVLAVEAGAVIHVDRQAIADRSDAIVPVELTLPVPSTNDDARKVHLLVVGGRGVELESHPLAGRRDRVRIDLPAEVLAEPGRYVVHVETTEKAHIAARRFAIEVH